MPWVTTPEINALSKRLGDERKKVRSNGLRHYAKVADLLRLAGVDPDVSGEDSEIIAKMAAVRCFPGSDAKFWADGTEEFQRAFAEKCGFSSFQADRWVKACWQLQCIRAQTNQVQPFRLAPRPFPFRHLWLRLDGDGDYALAFLRSGGNLVGSLAGLLAKLRTGKDQVQTGCEALLAPVGEIISCANTWFIPYLEYLCIATGDYIETNESPQENHFKEILNRDLRKLPMLTSDIVNAVALPGKEEWVKTDEHQMLKVLIKKLKSKHRYFTTSLKEDSKKLLSGTIEETESSQRPTKTQRVISGRWTTWSTHNYEWDGTEMARIYTEFGIPHRRRYLPSNHDEYIRLSRDRLIEMLYRDRSDPDVFDRNFMREILKLLFHSYEKCAAQSLVDSFHITVGRPFYVATVSDTKKVSTPNYGRCITADVVSSKQNHGWDETPKLELKKPDHVIRTKCKVETPPPTLTRKQQQVVSHAWLHQASGEHASIASFAHHTLELLKYEAPPDLIEGALKAGQDEVRHAKLCFQLGSLYSPKNDKKMHFQPASLQMTSNNSSPSMAPSLEAMACRIMRDGCFGESISVLIAARQLARAKACEVKKALQEIVRDESGHAALAWESVYWCIVKNIADSAKMIAMIRDLTVTFNEELKRMAPSSARFVLRRELSTEEQALEAYGVPAGTSEYISASAGVCLMKRLLEQMKIAVHLASGERNASVLHCMSLWSPRKIIDDAVNTVASCSN